MQYDLNNGDSFEQSNKKFTLIAIIVSYMHPLRKRTSRTSLFLKTRAQMATELGISSRTLRRKILKSKLGITPGLLTRSEQKAILALFIHTSNSNHIDVLQLDDKGNNDDSLM